MPLKRNNDFTELEMAKMPKRLDFCVAIEFVEQIHRNTAKFEMR